MTVPATAEEAPDPCSGCGSAPSPTLPVTWSPAFGQYLCATCRRRRTEAELNETEAANTRDRAASRAAGRLRLFGGRSG